MNQGTIYIEKADFEILVLFDFDYTEAEPQEEFYPGIEESVCITHVTLDVDQMDKEYWTNDSKVLAGKLFTGWHNYEELEDEAWNVIKEANEQ
jgi:hypothetical protein